jgi:2-methylcitrate dehydratase PrpD
MSVAESCDHLSGAMFLVTSDAANWVAGLDPDDIPEDAYTRAKHALLDWLGCTIAGRKEPLVTILLDEFAGSGGESTLIAAGRKASLLDAALINGAAAHALDYDDVNRQLHGHPTACVAPATMLLAETLGSGGRETLAAFVAGTEVACSLGGMCEEGHYEAGFHATGTMGTFGAAAAAARLMGLDAHKTAMALGIAASQAAGLKVNFGTMTKPFHAGKAAMNGLLGARLAARGFTASDAAIEGAHGFAQAQSPGFDDGPIRPEPSGPWAVERMLYKYHASCFLTHSTLNAIRELREKHGIGLDDVASATLKVRSTHTSVCCIPEPETGLEIKFSIQHLAAMGFDGADTGALATYSDENATDPRYVEAHKRMALDLIEGMDRSAAVVTANLNDGRTLVAEDNVGIPAADHGEQWNRLSTKFTSITVPVVGEERSARAAALIDALDEQSDLHELMKVAG